MAEATNENGDVTTSSPSLTPTARSARCRPAVPDETAQAWRRAEARGERRLEGGHLRAERQLAGAQHLQHRLLLLRAEDRPGERDDVLGRPRHVGDSGAARRTAAPRAWCTRPGSMPASSESTSASQLASMTFSLTPIVPQVSVPSEASRSTRVTAPVAFCSSRMRTL